MLGMLFYLGGCFLVSAVATFLYVITRPIEARDEMRSWRTWMVMYVLTFGGPYGYAEFLTRYYGEPMKDAVLDGLDLAGIQGDLKYYRLVKFGDNKARAIVVSQEPADWGGTERPVVALNLIKGKSGWEVDTYKVVNSDSRNADGWTFPPFY